MPEDRLHWRLMTPPSSSPKSTAALNDSTVVVFDGRATYGAVPPFVTCWQLDPDMFGAGWGRSRGVSGINAGRCPRTAAPRWRPAGLLRRSPDTGGVTVGNLSRSARWWRTRRTPRRHGLCRSPSCIGGWRDRRVGRATAGVGVDRRRFGCVPDRGSVGRHLGGRVATYRPGRHRPVAGPYQRVVGRVVGPERHRHASGRHAICGVRRVRDPLSGPESVFSSGSGSGCRRGRSVRGQVGNPVTAGIGFWW